jgi:hypothetical protein
MSLQPISTEHSQERFLQVTSSNTIEEGAARESNNSET